MMRTNLRFRSVVLLFGGLLLMWATACGGMQQGPFSEVAWERSGPGFEEQALWRWLQEQPADLREALEMAYLLDAAGDPMRAVDLLGNTALVGSPLEEALRALRLHALSSRVPAFEDRIAPWLEQARTTEEGYLLTWLLWSELRALAAWRAHRWSMAPGLPQLAHRGVPTSWAMLGPYSPWDAEPGEEGENPSTSSWLEAPEDDASGSRLLDLATRLPATPLPMDEPSVGWMESVVEVEEPSAWLFAMATSASTSLYVNDLLVLEGDPETRMDRGTVARWVEMDPGVHRVRLRVAHHGGSANLWVRAFPIGERGFSRWSAPDRQGERAISGRAHVGEYVELLPGEPPRRGEVALWGWGEWTALVGGMSARLRLVQADQSAEDPVWVGLQAAWLDDLQLLEPEDRVAIALSRLEAAEDSWTAGLRLKRAELLLEAGRTRAALDLYEQLALERPLHPAVHDGHGRAWLALQSPELAERAWQRAWQLFPTHCGVVTRWARVRLSRGEALREDQIPEAWLACDVGHEVALLSSIRPEGLWDTASERTERLAQREPWLATRLEAWLDAAWTSTDNGALVRWQGFADQWAGDRSIALRSALDQALLSGDREALDGAVEAIRRWAPSEPVVSLIAALLTELPEQLAGMRTVHAQRRAWEEAGQPGDTPLVLLLESSDVRWEEGGHRSVLRHQLIAVTSREGMEFVGELGLPSAGAELLRLAVHKPDGRVRVPASDPNRRAVSMPDLEVGDVVEMAWLQRGYLLLPGHVVQEVSPIVLGSDEWAIFEASASFSWPSSLDASLVWDVRGLEFPDPTVLEDGRRARSWSVQALQPGTPEPFTTGLRERAPSVRVGLEMDAHLRRRMEANRIARATVVDDLLREEALKWSPQRRREAARLRALFRSVVDEVRSDYGHFDRLASAQWRAREGDRLAILVTLLRAAGWSPQVVFVNSTEAAPLADALIDVTAWDHTVVRVEGGEGVWWLDPLDEDAPFDYLRPELRERPAWVIHGPGEGEVLRTPRSRPDEEERRIHVDATWTEDGRWEGSFVDAIPARLGPAWRGWLRSVGDERSLLQELERELVETFPGVEMSEVRVEGLDDPDAVLRVHARFTVSTPSPEQGRVALQLLPRAVGRAYASLAERSTPLVHFSMWERATVRLSLPVGWHWRAERTEDRVDGWGWRSLSLEDSARTLVWRRELALPAGRVEPEAYPAFASAMRRLQEFAHVEAVVEQR